MKIFSWIKLSRNKIRQRTNRIRIKLELDRNHLSQKLKLFFRCIKMDIMLTCLVNSLHKKIQSTPQKTKTKKIWPLPALSGVWLHIFFIDQVIWYNLVEHNFRIVHVMPKPSISRISFSFLFHENLSQTRPNFIVLFS